MPVFDKEIELKKIFLLVLIIFGLELVGQQDADKGYISLEELTKTVLPQAKNQKSIEDRKHFIFEQMERVFPRDMEKNPADIKYLPELFETIDNEADKQAVFTLFDLGVNFKEKNESIIDAAIELLDDDYPTDVRYASILILKQIQSPKSIAALRKLIKTFPYTWEKVKSSMIKSNDYKQRLPMTAAVILGKLKDKESAPLLFEKLEKLGPKGHRALAECGAIAVPGLLERAREEIVDKKDGWAFKALLYIPKEDEEAKQILRNAFRSETDAYYQSGLLVNVIFNVNGTNDRDFLKQLQKEYENWDEGTRYSIVGFSNQSEDRQFILSVVSKEKDSQIKSTAISQLGIVGNESDLIMLEKLAQSGNKIIKANAEWAIRGIKKLPFEIEIRDVNGNIKEKKVIDGAK